MTATTFFWHDYETFGPQPRRDRPAQFAGVRTDLELNEIAAPVELYCRPAPDFLPDPESCLLTGILPQTCLARGLPEHRFAQAVEHELAADGTIGVGYNSIRFDDEVTRSLLWRNLIDPYGREFQNGCGRWDLLDVVRCCYALRPDRLAWPKHEDGRASFRLADLSAANGLAHDAAHDALSDVRATVGLARLLRAQEPRLWDFCLALRRKERVWEELHLAAPQPFLHVSGMYPAERGCLAVVWPLALHPRHRNELIVWDLASDPAELLALDAAAIRSRLFVRRDELPEGIERLPIKTIHVNRSPIVVGNLKVLRAAEAERWNLDLQLVARHAASAAAVTSALSPQIWAEVYEQASDSEPRDVDEDLYGGLIGLADRRLLESLRRMEPAALATAQPAFEDARLGELLFRYRARNFSDSLSDDERGRWAAHCAARLHEGQHGALTLAQFAARIDALHEHADEHAEAVLAALIDYAEQIAPVA